MNWTLFEINICGTTNDDVWIFNKKNNLNANIGSLEIIKSSGHYAMTTSF